jgi:protein TorT
MTLSAKTIGIAVLGGIALAAAAPGFAAADENAWYPFKVQVWDPPFDMASPRKDMDYTPVE